MSGYDDPERFEAEWAANMKRLTQHVAALVRVASGETVAEAAIVFTHRPRERKHVDRKYTGRRRLRHERLRGRN
ncbi:MAG: hypothetical protein M3Q31_23400 [Actinomycetota bacterium]|nr:hypothetical protein [Actinomycetota bacterium]